MGSHEGCTCDPGTHSSLESLEANGSVQTGVILAFFDGIT